MKDSVGVKENINLVLRVIKFNLIIFNYRFNLTKSFSKGYIMIEIIDNCDHYLLRLIKKINK